MHAIHTSKLMATPMFFIGAIIAGVVTTHAVQHPRANTMHKAQHFKTGESQRQLPENLMVARTIQEKGIEAALKLPLELENPDAGGSDIWNTTKRKNPDAETPKMPLEFERKGNKAKDAGHPSDSMMPQAKMLAAYGAAMLFMIACVTVMFFPMGIGVCIQVVIYVSCLALVKIAMKLVFECDFHYPKFVTAMHLLVSSLAAFVILIQRRLTLEKPIAVPTSEEFFFGVLPIALTFGFSIGAENSALVFVSAAFSEVVACTNPVMSAFLTWAVGMEFNMQLVLPILVVVAGCAISVSGEMFFSAFGLLLLLLSVFFRGLKAVMQQKLMTGETKEKFDPVTLMAWTCMLSFVECLIYSLASEGMAPFTGLATSTDLPRLLTCLIGSCVIACTLNMSALFVIKQLGAVGMQMVSQMKSILVVMGGVLILSEPFTNTQKMGFATVLSGVYWYSHMKQALSPNAKGGH